MATAAASVCLHFYILSPTRMLNSFEELCLMPAAVENSFARVLNPHGGAYILFRSDMLYIYIYIYIYIYMREREREEYE